MRKLRKIVRNTLDYGNIYTPKAGQMIIHVQRENGLGSRTIVLSERQVRLLRYVLSRTGIALGCLLLASWIFLAVQAARVPLLTRRLTQLEHAANRLDSLSAALARANGSYERLERMLRAVPPGPAHEPSTAILHTDR